MPEFHPDAQNLKGHSEFTASTLRAAIPGLSPNFPDRQVDAPGTSSNSGRNILLLGVFLGAGLLGYWLGGDPLDLEF